MTIVVLGSINADLVLKTDRLPRPGETVRAHDLATHPGGKGANQAIAAARLGADVLLVGRVGDDAAGRTVLAALREAGVDITRVGVDAAAPTGTALITVATSGDNTIVTAGGANHRVGSDELERLGRVLPDASVLLIQLEVPMDVVEHAVVIARDTAVPVILDPAPVTEIPAAVLDGLDWITPNEQEAEALTGAFDPEAQAGELRGQGVRHVAITLGAAGCFYSGPDGGRVVAAPKVATVDTVACGDAFNGALATTVGRSGDMVDKLSFACAAGAAAATREGAAPSVPTLEEVMELIDRPNL